MIASPTDVISGRGGVTSVRLFDRVVEEIYTALPLTLRDFVKDQFICEQWNEGSEYGFPSLSVTPEVGEWQEGQLLSLTSLHFGKFQDYYSLVERHNGIIKSRLKKIMEEMGNIGFTVYHPKNAQDELHLRKGMEDHLYSHS